MREPISIWWFAGLLLLIYGIVILSTGIWELSHPLLHPPVLNRLRAPIWWGGLLLAAGLGYTIGSYPRKIAGHRHRKG